MKGLTQKELYHQGYLQRIWTRYDRQNSAGPEDQSPLCSFVSVWYSRYLFTKQFIIIIIVIVTM